MALPILAQLNEGFGEREEATCRGGILELCEGSPDVDDQQRSTYIIPPIEETPRATPTARHYGHVAPHLPKKAGALGGQAPLHAPCGAWVGGALLW